ncbi:MAG: DUF2975 domain-containing protein [Pseudomonadota bacterium]
MSRKLSLVIAWACSALLIAIPAAAVFYLVKLGSFATLTQSTVGLPIQWWTVSDSQWYALWGLTVAYLSIGLAGLFFLRRAFNNFSKGELFNANNSHDLRRFSVLLLAQAVATPVHLSLMSVILSWNHPAGQKMLSIAIGSNELRAVGVALVLWVLSDLLVEACRVHAENKQFV